MVEVKAVTHIIVLLLACGCVGSGGKVKRAADFRIDNLRQEGLVMAGVTALGGGEYLPGETVSRRFREAMHKREPDVRYVGMFELRERLGAAKHAELMKRFSDREMIPDELWEKLDEDQRLPGYLLWLDITRDDESAADRRGKNVTYRWVTDADGRRFQVVDRVEYVTTASARRSVAAVFTVYERESRRQVWSASLNDGMVSSESRRHLFGYPAAPKVTAPGTYEVLERVTERAAKLLTVR